MQRTSCSPVDRDSLLAAIGAAVIACLEQCANANADLAVVEDAVETAVQQVVKLLRQAGANEAMSQGIPWQCPQCRRFLGYHDTQVKDVLTRHGLVQLRRGRYRCRMCEQEYVPVDVLNDLQRSGFSLGAREAGVNQAVRMAFASASDAGKPTLPISIKSLERMVSEASGWLKAEQKSARAAFYGDRERVSRERSEKPVGLVSGWLPREIPAGAVLCIAADGGKVRSTSKGADGRLEWFEARAATISLTFQGKELPRKQAGGKVCLAGVFDVDELFETLGVVYECLPEALKGLRQVFTGDGGPWWERAKEHFAGATEILDIYHAGENLASAAAACFGEGSAKTRHWREHVRDWLMEPGRLEQLLGELFRARPSAVANPKGHHEVRKKLAYFRQHRERMRYWEYEVAGLPIGSGVIESGVKQTVIARLRQAGMKWTVTSADAVLRLRGAWLSGELPHLFARRRQACSQAASVFYEALQTAA